MHRLEWFYPAFMIALGAHYLPFTFLYGMPMFAALCGVLVSAGALLGTTGAGDFATGGWITGSVLLLFAGAGLRRALKEEAEKRPAWRGGGAPGVERPKSVRR